MEYLNERISVPLEELPPNLAQNVAFTPARDQGVNLESNVRSSRGSAYANVTLHSDPDSSHSFLQLNFIQEQDLDSAGAGGHSETKQLQINTIGNHIDIDNTIAIENKSEKTKSKDGFPYRITYSNNQIQVASANVVDLDSHSSKAADHVVDSDSVASFSDNLEFDNIFELDPE
eukprot:CAMPEP_0116944948 /NCGR_PEP_ID=MMETSP0467-20121206/36072_1 /TAXON_ID=283647 /ORGANISM="Mesodinium pulex, Strain SPMC105" /LENGTH=173 /DNA_ID=CAMNT_0004628389 /DNA_START=197 /DNA_END=718 /DNA_ORIENTATION=+